MNTRVNPQMLRFLREAKGWDQLTLANKAGINPSVISRLERGLQKDFKISIIVALAQTLETSVDSLLTAPNHPVQTELTVELEATMKEISRLGKNYQHQVAAILQAYLSAMPKETDKAED